MYFFGFGLILIYVDFLMVIHRNKFTEDYIYFFDI